MTLVLAFFDKAGQQQRPLHIQSYVGHLLVMGNRFRSLHVRSVYRQRQIVGHDRHHVQYLGQIGHVVHEGNLHMLLCTTYRQV